MNILRERYHFHHRQQKLHETIEDFALELRRLASSCQFNELEASLVRDHLLFGLRNQSLTIEIIDSGGDPNLDDVLQICMVLENNHTLPQTLPPNPNDRVTDESVKKEPHGMEYMQDSSFIDIYPIVESANLSKLYPEAVLLEEINDTKPQIVSCYEDTPAINDACQISSFPAAMFKSNNSKRPRRTKRPERRVASPKSTADTSLLVPLIAISSKQCFKRKSPYADAPSLPCPFCQRVFKDRKFFKQHVKNKHKELSFSCSICQRPFKNQATLERHLHAQHPETVEGEELRQYECYVCHSACKSLPVLRSHLYSHTRNRKYLCNQCGFMAHTPQNLDKHMMRNDHNLTGEMIKPHRCDLCGQGFASKYTLGIHATTHSDVRDTPCSLCGKLFKNKKALGQHMLLHGERRHQCQMCSYKCYSPGNLKLHMKVHTGRGNPS